MLLQLFAKNSPKLLPSFFCHNEGFFRKPTSPPLPLMNSFLKSPRPSLPLKRAPPLSPSPFPLRGQGMCQPPYSVLKPLRYKVGGPSEVFASSGAAVFCAGMNPLSLKDLVAGCLLIATCSMLARCLMLAAHTGCLLFAEGLLPRVIWRVSRSTCS